MKTCTKCKSVLDESMFNWKQKGVKLSYHCKNCSRKYVKEHYANNKGYYVSKAKNRNKMLREEAYSYIGPYLLSHPCVDCGETNILVLEFDHRLRKMKESEISHIITNGGRLSKVINEIAKCDIRCSNCHRKKTEIENNSWKLKYLRP